MTPSSLTSQRVVYCVLFATGIASLLCLWVAWCEFPIYSWNEARLAPAFALRHGINPYPPVGGGPLSTWIYGPVGVLVNLPATFATTAVGALHSASLINFAVLILPLALIFFSAKDLSPRGPATRWLAVAVAVLLIPRPNLLLQVADHSAIACGLISCWWLARRPQPTAAALGIAATFCALALWSKQIAVFLIAAQVTYLLTGGQRAAAIKYLLWLTVLGIASLGLAVTAFGWSNLWLNLVDIPGRLPWTDNIGDRLLMRPWALVAQIGLPSIALAVFWFTKQWPSRESETGRFFQLSVLAFTAMLPVGVAAYLKIGGDTNLLHSWDYLLPGAVLVWLATEHQTRAALLRLLTVSALAIGLRATDVVAFPVKPFTGHLDTATELINAYPHAIWFPRNPIITFYADGKLWHSEDGIQTRYLANYGLREPDFRRHLPPGLQAVAYPSNMEFPFSMPLLAWLDQTIKVPFWTVHVRAPVPPEKP